VRTLWKAGRAILWTRRKHTGELRILPPQSVDGKKSGKFFIHDPASQDRQGRLWIETVQTQSGRLSPVWRASNRPARGRVQEATAPHHGAETPRTGVVPGLCHRRSCYQSGLHCWHCTMATNGQPWRECRYPDSYAGTLGDLSKSSHERKPR
jgi:hypothetical protein